MALLGGIILWEVTNATKVVLGALLGEEPKVTFTRGFEFTMRPEYLVRGKYTYELV
jgi:hypothetical protein